MFYRDADELFSDDCLRIARAAARGDIHRLDQLLAGKTPVDCRGDFETTPLYWAIAAKETSLEGTEHLLKSGADPNHFVKTGEALVHLAAMRGDERLMGLLLKYGANPNLPDKRAKQTALFHVLPGGFAVVSALLDAGADMNHRAANEGTPMMTLAATRQFKAIHYMLSAGADWTVKSKSGDSLVAIMKRTEHTWDTESPEYPYYLKTRELLKLRGAEI